MITAKQTSSAASEDAHLTFTDYFNQQRTRIEAALKAWYQGQNNRAVEAASYSLLGSSKRIRPLFCLETCRAIAGSDTAALSAAMALEMVHTYSLIHDDLPAMDNDDLRRGRPTNHKVYGDATAILAGDGLLTSAFEVLAKASDIDAGIRVEWVNELSVAAGLAGMVLGQQLDMESKEDFRLADLEDLHRKKTGALLAASVVMGAQAAEAPQQTIEVLREFALDMGLAFQIRDDVLDVVGGAEIGKPVLSDEKNSKVTYVSLLGLEGATQQSKLWFDRAMSRLKLANLAYSNRLEELTRFVVERKV